MIRRRDFERYLCNNWDVIQVMEMMPPYAMR